MKTVSHLASLGKRDRKRILDEHPGFLNRICEITGKTKATVSRVFNGKISRSPEVKAAIESELNNLMNQQAA